MEPLPPFGQRPLVLKEGGGGLPVLLLRACSYKTKAEAWHQGKAPILFKGFITVFFNPYQEPRTVLNDNIDNTDNEDNRNRKGNLSWLCCMSPRDIPQLRPFFLLLSLSLLASILIRRFFVFIKNCSKKPSSGGLVVFLNDNTDNGDNEREA